MKKILIWMWVGLFFASLAWGAETTTQASPELPKLKFTGFARARYTFDFTAGKPDGFSISQARFGITGAISSKFSYSFSLEGTVNDPENKKMIYDVFIDSTIISFLKLRVGQFKYAFGLEQTTSDPDLELINKADVVSNLVKPSRDIGLQAGYNLPLKGIPSTVTVGVFNGSGSNADDENSRKSIVGRLTVAPVKGMTFGSSVYSGTTGAANDHKSRIGVDLKWEYRKLLIKGEYISGKDINTKKDGFYATVGYTFLRKTMALIRYDRWNSDRATADKDISRVTFGLNHFFDKNVLLQINYELKNEAAKLKNDLFMIQMQIKY